MEVPKDTSDGLMSGSISDTEIVLGYEDAIHAIDLLMERAVAVIAWEGWIGYPDGTLGHHPRYQGTVEIERREGQTREAFVKAAAAFQRRTIEQAQHEFLKNETTGDAALFFCLSTTSREDHERP